MARCANYSGERGFSLLEVMVALAVLAITFVVLLDLRNRDIARHLHSGRLTTATLLAQDRLVALELSGVAEPGDLSGTFPGFGEFAWSAQVLPTVFDRVREVRLLVFWNEGPRQEQVELLTYVYDER